MICITSISPTHINKGQQQKAINSWHKLGFKVYSFNHPSEIILLKQYKNVIFIPTQDTMKHVFKKHYVSIKTMIDWAKTQSDPHCCFINSDIELEMSKGVIKKIKNAISDKMAIANRWDYVKRKIHSNRYLAGIDVFFVNQKHLHIFPPSMFCMGQCFWDYNMPFTAMKHNIPVINIQNQIAFHKKHPVQYSHKNWEIMGKHFILEHNLPHTSIEKVSTMAFNLLELKQEKVKL
jgi:hypothetical protein